MSTISTQSNVTIVDSEADLLPLLDSIPSLAIDPPSLYIDLEGIALGRHGTLSILTLYISPSKKTYLIDIYRLGSTAFSTINSSGTSLQTVLESPSIPKVFFDIRNDSDALFSLFHISVDGIKDLQLMELATRTGSKAYLAGLAKCIEREAPVSPAAKMEWKLIKERGRRLFLPEKGGTHTVFNERPLKPEIVEYCKQDVTFLPGLYGVYNAKLSPAGQTFWRLHVRHTTKERIELSQKADYNGHSQSNALGWDDDSLQEDMDSWNDMIMTEHMAGDFVLDEHDNWVAPPRDDLEDFFDRRNDDEEEDEDEDWDDGYQDTARDCIGWEEDMMKNGELF